MNTTMIAAMILLIVGVGLYIGVTNLATQYGIEPSGGNAGEVACAPQAAEAKLNQPVKFTESGVPAQVAYHWAADQGRIEVTADGGLEARFATAGLKTVYLFHATGGRWYRTACSVLVK